MALDRFRAYGPRQLDHLVRRFRIPAELAETVRLHSLVLPFRVNEFVVSELIDWDRVPDDPMYQLVFPQPGMLDADDEKELAQLGRSSANAGRLAAAIARIRRKLNPHPGGQQDLNVPTLDGARLRGIQHKYRETVLYFPASGQTCHAYCTYCFRWAQFVDDSDLRFSAPGPDELVSYLHAHPDVDDVLITGGDPLVMSTARLGEHVRPLLEVPSVRTIRIGTKSLAYWPGRFSTDPDADDLLQLLEDVVSSGRTVAVMAHFSHPREIDTDLARRGLSRVRSTGAVVYAQAPLIRHVNDDAAVWSALWRKELAAGVVPYYLFVTRDTGPHGYFQVPLDHAYRIFTAAYRSLPGLARTVRGPVMSTTAGKVLVDGIEETSSGQFFQLRMVQARDPRLVGRPFRAYHSPNAVWLDDLTPHPDTPFELAAAVRPDTRVPV